MLELQEHGISALGPDGARGSDVKCNISEGVGTSKLEMKAELGDNLSTSVDKLSGTGGGSGLNVSQRGRGKLGKRFELG